MNLVSFLIYGSQSARLIPYRPENFELTCKDVELDSKDVGLGLIVESEDCYTIVVDGSKELSRSCQITVDKAKGVWKLLEKQALYVFKTSFFLGSVTIGLILFLDYQKKPRLYVVAFLAISAVSCFLGLKSAKAVVDVQAINNRFGNNIERLKLLIDAEVYSVMRLQMRNPEQFFNRITNLLQYVTKKELDNLYIKYLKQWLQDNKDPKEWKSKIEKEQTPFTNTIIQLFSCSSDLFIRSIYMLFKATCEIEVIAITANCYRSTVENCLYALLAEQINQVLKEEKEHSSINFLFILSLKIGDYLKNNPENKEWKDWLESILKADCKTAGCVSSAFEAPTSPIYKLYSTHQYDTIVLPILDKFSQEVV
ncbi:MAG: hypothetical protein ACRDFB_03500, partial [Rhabdochlamydiaceae bacterium]